MTRIRSAFFALMALLVSAAANAGEPVIRVVMPAGAPYLAGQRIDVEVQVLVPNFFMSALQFPTLDVPGAVVTLSDDRALNFNETIGGETYSGIRKSYSIVPEQAGTFTLPPARIAFSYAAVPGQATQAFVTIPQQAFEVTLPPGAMGPNGPLPLAPLEITQTFDPKPDGLKAGDTLTRTVNIFAANMQAMMIPPPKFAAPDGVKIYLHDPVLSNEKRDGRDFVGGRRIDRVTYEFTKPGEYVFPEIVIDWYNVAAGKVETVRAPELKVSIAAAVSTAPAIAPEAPAPEPKSWLRTVDWEFWLPRGLAAFAAVLILSLVFMRYAPRLRASMAARRFAHQQSEAVYFRKLTAACRSNDRVTAYRALSSWMQAANIGSLAAWARSFGGPALMSEIDRLNTDLFSGRAPDAGWNSRSLEIEFAKARNNWLEPKMRPNQTILPELNPYGAQP